MATDSSSSDGDSSLDSSTSSGGSSLMLSYESSPFASSSEDSGPEGMHPFLYEPLASSGSSDGDDDSSDDDVSPRLLNLNW